LALAAILLLPISVSAGLFNAFGSLFGGSNGDEESLGNLQSMKLLASITSPADNSYSDLNVVDGSLDAESGPSPELVSRNPSSDQISIYVVREGDTISQIAHMFNVTANTIRWNNDLSGSGIRPGQTLVILPISGVKHMVNKGDTLASIAKKYKADIDEIAAYNGLPKNSPLALGSTIIVPDGEISSSPSSGSSSIGGKIVSGLKEFVGYYLRPITGGKKTQGIHGHNGVDLAAQAGTPIMAAADGQVIISKMGGWNGGYGNYVVIKHNNGTQTLYAHNLSNTVVVGETVKQGQVIGHMGATGKATGVHLHFEIRGAKNPF
jgi:LysM repeat protein